MSILRYNVIVKCFAGYEYALKYRNVSDNRLDSMINYLLERHKVGIIFLYDSSTRRYAGYWTKKTGFRFKN